jgi:hypothetical protein
VDWPLLVDLIHSTKGILEDIRDLSRLSREQFVDKDFENFFYKQISSDIDQIDLLLDGFLSYVRATTPVARKDTLNTLIEEVLRKYQHTLEERKIGVFKNLEKELPETVVPDEHMAFIVDSIVQYAIVVMPFGGNIIFSTESSSVAPRPTCAAPVTTGGDYSRKSVEITAVYQGSDEQLRTELKPRSVQRETAMNLLLRLVRILVRENKGTMEHEADETKARGYIVLKFSSDRRRGVHYQPAGQ